MEAHVELGHPADTSDTFRQTKSCPCPRWSNNSPAYVISLKRDHNSCGYYGAKVLSERWQNHQ